MSKLKKERLDQMIENALSYKQEVKTLKSNSFYRRIKSLILKTNIYGIPIHGHIIQKLWIRLVHFILLNNL